MCDPKDHHLIHTLDLSVWQGAFSESAQRTALAFLEQGSIIYCPQLPFELLPQEKEFLTPRVLNKKAKNISFNVKTQQLSGCRLNHEKLQALAGMLARYQGCAASLLQGLIPYYQESLLTGRTSYRPVETVGRKTSLLKNDTKLHVDAFSATPTQGKRILRVFTNINPHGQSRHWNLGEPFEAVVKHFTPTLGRPFWGSRWLLALCGITKSYRSLYDHYMLQLHNHMKLDAHYQETVKKTSVHFPAGASWIVMTDHVSHAALSGQYLLEQTFYLPVSGMQHPEWSPLKVLERFKHIP